MLSNKMKQIILFIFITLISKSVFAQNFEGRVIYQIVVKSKSPQLTSGQLNAMIGNTQEFFIKGGYNKSVYNRARMEWQIYRPDENKLFTKQSEAQVIYWENGTVQNDEILKTEINRQVIEVLGYQCDELILTCKSGLYKYYFNSQLGINAKLYKKCKYNNVATKLALIKALSLKSIVEVPLFNIESTAIEVKPMKLDKKLFELPAGVKIEKAPF